MDSLIRRYLEIVAPSNTVTLQFRKADRYIYAAEVKDERCLRRARWILGVRSPLTDSAILRQTPSWSKSAPPRVWSSWCSARCRAWS